MRIAFQGATGAYSESAARRAWPESETVPLERFEDVFDAVEAATVTHGILPIENSVGGSIHRNYDLLLEHELPIVGETELTVVHNLLALPGTSLARDPAGLLASAGARAVRAVRSHVAGRRSRRDLRHSRQRAVDPGGRAAGHRRDRVGPCRGDLRSGHPQGGHPGFRGQHHALHRDLARSAAAGSSRQDDARLCAAQRAWSAIQGAERVCAERHRPHQAGVAPRTRAAVGVLFYADVGVGREDVRGARAIGHLSESARWVRTLGSYARWSAEPPAGQPRS